MDYGSHGRTNNALYLTCSTILSVDLARNGVSRSLGIGLPDMFFHTTRFLQVKLKRVLLTVFFSFTAIDSLIFFFHYLFI